VSVATWLNPPLSMAFCFDISLPHSSGKESIGAPHRLGRMSISNPDVGGTRAYVHIGRVTCHICFRTFTKASAESSDWVHGLWRVSTARGKSEDARGGKYESLTPNQIVRTYIPPFGNRQR
jgi:hypothetical protein